MLLCAVLSWAGLGCCPGFCPTIDALSDAHEQHTCFFHLFLILIFVPCMHASNRVEFPGHSDLPQPRLPGIADKAAAEPFARTSELAAKLPQRPITPPAKDTTPSESQTPTTTTTTAAFRKPSMDYQDDPWNTPDLHKGHNHAAEPTKTNGEETSNGSPPVNSNGHNTHEEPSVPLPGRTTSTFTTASAVEPAVTSRPSSFAPAQSPGGAWGGDFFGADGGPVAAASPFGPPSNGGREPGEPRPNPILSRTIGSGRTGSAVEETIVVTLLPEKEGMFMFQHHNYEVASSRRGSKVIRRYSDFVWLLDCLHKRYPYRILPLLPPKRVAGKQHGRDHTGEHVANKVASQRQSFV